MTGNAEHKPDYEERFAHRFSADDAIYQEYRSRPADPPPIVENWSSRGRDHRHRGGGGRGGRGGGGRGWHGDRGWGGDHRRQQDRWGHESGHQAGHQGYDQGYNPYNQRPYHSY